MRRYSRYSRYRTKTHDKCTISHVFPRYSRYQTVLLKLQEINYYFFGSHSKITALTFVGAVFLRENYILPYGRHSALCRAVACWCRYHRTVEDTGPYIINGDGWHRYHRTVEDAGPHKSSPVLFLQKLRRPIYFF